MIILHAEAQSSYLFNTVKTEFTWADGTTSCIVDSNYDWLTMQRCVGNWGRLTNFDYIFNDNTPSNCIGFIYEPYISSMNYEIKPLYWNNNGIRANRGANAKTLVFVWYRGQTYGMKLDLLLTDGTYLTILDAAYGDYEIPTGVIDLTAFDLDGVDFAALKFEGYIWWES